MTDWGWASNLASTDDSQLKDTRVLVQPMRTMSLSFDLFIFFPIQPYATPYRASRGYISLSLG